MASSLPSNRGFLLVDVLAGMLILALALAAALPTVLALVDRIGEQSMLLGVLPMEQNREADPWSWGPQPIGARVEGHELVVDHARVSASPSSVGRSILLGVWIEGVFQAETTLDEPGLILEEDADVPGGRELVVRARVDGGPWGPPWRHVIDGPAEERDVPGAHSGAAVLHGRYYGQLEATYVDTDRYATTVGVSGRLELDDVGRGQASVEGMTQTWRLEEGRHPHLFY